MKEIILSMVAVIGMSSVGFADENTAPVEQEAEEKSWKDRAEGLYLGIMYTHLSHDVDRKDETIITEMDFKALSLQLGYRFNPYISVEGRYGMTFGDPDVSDAPIANDAEITVWGIYAKPMYPVAPEFDIYALLGYASTNATGTFIQGGSHFNVDESGFSWGAGGEYAVTDEISVFADYLLFYDDNSAVHDKVIDSFNFGVTYQF